MKFYSILDDGILLREVNHHPVFSYALKAIESFTNDFTLYVTDPSLIDITTQYTKSVKVLNEEDHPAGEKLPLNKPLLTVEHLNGKHDKTYKYEVIDEIDLISVEGLIKSDFCKSRPSKIRKPYLVDTSPNPNHPKLLITAPYLFFNAKLKNYIENTYDVVYAYNAPKHIVKQLLADRELIFISTAPGYLFDDDLLNSAPNLRIIATPSTGTTHIDLEAVKKKELEIVSIKESPVIEQIYASSEFTFTLLLGMINKLPMVCEYAKYGNWRELEVEMRSRELNGLTIGLLGYGRIGKKMTKFSRALDMNVLVYDPLYQNVESKEGLTFCSTKEEVIKNADIVSIHYHMSAENYKSFTKEDFQMMKEGSYFLNTARGELIDEAALLENLKSGKIVSAAVDVIDQEHLPDKWNNQLIKYARENHNLLVAPHVAGLTNESETKAAQDIFDQLKKYL